MGLFPKTNWDMVVRFQEDTGRGSEATESAGEFCHSYWRPVYAYVRWKGMDPEDAQDVTQEIFSSLFSSGKLESVSSERGRLRSFLKAVAKRHVAEFVRHSGRQKRGGDQIRLPFDISEIEGALDFEAGVPEPEASFDRKWAMELLARVEGQLRDYHVGRDRLRWFEVLFPYLTSDAEGMSYADLARELESKEGSIKVGIYRMRRKYRELLRAEIAATVETPEEIEEELKALHAALKGE